jgi:protein-disulfide isomerase
MSEPAPSPRIWIFAALGALVLIVGLGVVAMQLGTGEGEDDRRVRNAMPEPRVIAEVPPPEPPKQHTMDNAEAFAFLDDLYRGAHHGQTTTRDEQLLWLEKAYGQDQRHKYNAHQPDPSAVFAVDISAAVAAGQVNGPADALVTIVIAWDYACPYCQRLVAALDELVAEYQGRLRVVYMNMVIHSQVQLAHQYGCAAAMQGKFRVFERAWWDKVWAVYATNRKAELLAEPNLKKVAAKAKLDVGKLASDANSPACEQRIADDRAELSKFRVQATPTWFVNGRHQAGARPKDQVRAVIEERLAVAVASGIPGADYYAKEVMAKGVSQFQSSSQANAQVPTRDAAWAWLLERLAEEKRAGRWPK